MSEIFFIKQAAKFQLLTYSIITRDNRGRYKMADNPMLCAIVLILVICCFSAQLFHMALSS